MRIESGNVDSYRTLDCDLAPTAPVVPSARNAPPASPVLPPAHSTDAPEPSYGILGALIGFFAGVGAACDSVLDGLRGAARSFGDLVAHPSRIAEQAVGIAILVAGKTAAALQSLFHLEPTGRHLREEERALLKQIFGPQLDLDALVIKTGRAGVFNLVEPDRAFTLGNTIYTKQDGELSTDVLVHEAVHVWQYQSRGADYIIRSLASQFTQGQTAAYDATWAIGAGASWSDLTVEQQGDLLQTAYVNGFFDAHNDEKNRKLLLTTAQGVNVDVSAVLRTGLAKIRGTAGGMQ